MGYYLHSEMSDDLTYTREEREALTEAFQALCCGPEVDRPIVEYADYDAFEFLDAEQFSVSEGDDGGLIVHGTADSQKATEFLTEITHVMSRNLGEDKGRAVWIIEGEDGDRWPWVFEHGHDNCSPEMTVTYKIHVSDTVMEVRGDDV